MSIESATRSTTGRSGYYQVVSGRYISHNEIRLDRLSTYVSLTTYQVAGDGHIGAPKCRLALQLDVASKLNSLCVSHSLSGEYLLIGEQYAYSHM